MDTTLHYSIGSYSFSCTVSTDWALPWSTVATIALIDYDIVTLGQVTFSKIAMDQTATIPAPTQQQAAPTSSRKPTQQHSSPILWIIIGLLLILVLMLGAVTVFLGLNNGSVKNTLRDWLAEDEITDVVDEDSDTPSDENTTDDADQDTTANTDTDTTDDSATDDAANITEQWNDYYNASWYIGFKYPKDLIVAENTSNPENTYIELKSGSDTSVITVWIQSMAVIDDTLSNMLANQCTDDISFSDVSYGTHLFRKAVDVPMSGCLSSPRAQELAAYGVLLPGEIVFAIRNDAMNQAQIEALLGTVYAE